MPGEIVVNWEPVREGYEGHAPRMTGHRLRVPGGWIYRPADLYRTGNGEQAIYIPDPNHEWGKEVQR